jgi:hypothetical protein
MKRSYLPALLILVVSSPLWSLAPVPVSSWYSLGLENQRVSSVIADDTTMILAGSDSGVSVRYGGKWFRAAGVRMPVSAMVRVSSENVVAAMSDGSKSDGLYIGTKIRGEPYYQFSLLCWITAPQALTVSDAKGDTLYAGNSEALYRCVLPNTSTDPTVLPEIIKIPPFAFGVEMPTCKALVALQGQLLAGGYDRSPNPGKANLLYNVKDSMRILRPMNIAAMAVRNFGLELNVPITLTVGTIDSGIYVGSNIIASTDPAPTKPWTRYDSPNKEPVNDLTAISIAAITIRPSTEALLVAVKSGVYWGTSGDWTELGSIPVVPMRLAKYGNASDSYLAGTDKGIYRYGPLSTGTTVAAGNSRMAALPPVSARGNSLIIALTKANRISIAVHDISGRLLCKIDNTNLSAGRNQVSLPLDNISRCPYMVSVTGSDGAAVIQSVVLGN